MPSNVTSARTRCRAASAPVIKLGLIALSCILVATASLLAQRPNMATLPPAKQNASRTALFPSEAIHYYNGDARVDLVIALDELFVPAEGNDMTRLPAALGTLGVDSEILEGNVTGGKMIRFDKPLVQRDLGIKAIYLNTREKFQGVSHVLYSSNKKTREEQVPQILSTRFSLKLKPGQDLNALASKYNFRVVEEVEYSEGTYIAESVAPTPTSSLGLANLLYEVEKVAFATPLITKQQSKRFVPNDTLYTDQWHLKNTGQLTGGVAGNDVNIEGAWNVATGSGVNIAIVDDGLEYSHEDLSANTRTDIDIDINFGDDDPLPDPAFDWHGTACAGIAAGVGNNMIGVAGAAFDAFLTGIRLISLGTNDQDEADAMNHQVNPANASDRIHISSNSWGPNDNGETLETFGPLTKAAIENGIANGRGGNGTIYVWAAGNGRCSGDNINLDGYASSRYTIAVGATDAAGVVSYYSERGASMLVNTPSSYGVCGSPPTAGTTTTDLTGADGYAAGNYEDTFGGTSSAAPLAAGVIALMLEANPDLTWRDVQYILVTTATKNDPMNTEWITNGAGLEFNLDYGFGRIDATAAVNAASTWQSIPDEAAPIEQSETIKLAIPETPGMLERTLSMSAPTDFRVEAVEVIVDATHTYRGDLNFTLISPSGTESELMRERGGDGNQNYNNTMFTTVANWGESANGDWTLRVFDAFIQDDGTLDKWTLRIHGFQEPTNEIRGYKWGDMNGNGIMDGDGAFQPVEPRLAGWTIYVDSNTNGQFDIGETNTQTAQDGSYSLFVPDGESQIREVMREGFTSTFPDSGFHTVNAVGNEVFDDINFGNAPPDTLPAPQILDCDDDSLFGQQPSESIDNISQDKFGTITDNFSGINGPICGVRWWGSHSEAFGVPCSPENDFEITFYADDNGAPSSTPIAGPFEVFPNRTETGLTNSEGNPIYRYFAYFPCIELSSGWISIVAIGDNSLPNCYSTWSYSPQGDGVIYLDNNNATGDMGFCLLPSVSLGGTTFECKAGSIYGQAPNVTEGILSEDGVQAVSDNFFGIDDPICNVVWWGFNKDKNNEQCEKERSFTIRFFKLDSEDNPFDLTSSVVTAAATPTGLQTADGLLIYRFEAKVDCVEIGNGWIQIIANEDPSNPDCSFHWMTSPDGDNLSNTAGGFVPGDMAFCLGTGIDPDPASLMCAPNSVVSQPVDLSIIGAFASDKLNNSKRVALGNFDFAPPRGGDPLCGVRWWGIFISDELSVPTFKESTFEISFYTDESGRGGVMLPETPDFGPFTVKPTIINTGHVLKGAVSLPVYRFDADFPCIPATSGAFSIVANQIGSKPDTVFHWLLSSDGDGQALVLVDGVGSVEERDLAFCLTTGLNCLDDSIFFQPSDLQPHGGSGIVAQVSDKSVQGQNLLALDNFFGLSEPICSVRWWGEFLDITSLDACSENPTFEITIFADESGTPSSIPYAGPFTVTPESIDTELDFFPGTFGGVTVQQFQADIPCVTLSDGWISIQANPAESTDCAFAINTAAPGDNQSYENVDGGGLSPNDYDLSFCLGTRPDLPGPVISTELFPFEGDPCMPSNFVGVGISIRGNRVPVGDYTISLEYPEEILKVDDVGNFFYGSAPYATFGTNSITLRSFTASDSFKNGTIAVVIFEVLSDPGDFYSITLNDVPNANRLTDRLGAGITHVRFDDSATNFIDCAAIPHTYETGGPDSDGDGFSDAIEIAMGTDEIDPFDKPDFGDADSSTITTLADALALYRQLQSVPRLIPYDPDLDINSDGVVNQTDALILYWFGMGYIGDIPATSFELPEETLQRHAP